MADLDNDGYPEVVQSGQNAFSIFKNNNGVFVDPIHYPDFQYNNHIFSIDAGDINKDGYIDILQAGHNYGPNVPQVLLNKSSGFTNMEGKTLEGPLGSMFLGDFEGDGDLDIVSAGSNGILLNSNGHWNLGASFPKSGTSWYANWCNLDADTHLEVLQAHGGSNYFIGNYILESHFPSMSISTTLTFPLFILDARFADYDSDGDLDMLARRMDGNGNKTWLYKNVNGEFVDVGLSFPWSETIDFGDINNDGLYDVILSGMMTETWWVFETAIYLNQGGDSFSKLNAGIPSHEFGRASIGDFDNDGDLDIPTQTGMYRNNSAVTNAPPVAPASTDHHVFGSSVELLWQSGVDDKTPTPSLTYNLAVRSEDGTIIVPSHALPSGKRQIYTTGNAWNNLSFNLSCLKKGTYYWKVQALDASYQGSAFSSEKSFTITTEPPVAPLNLTATTLSDVSIQLNWADVSATEDSFIILRKNADSDFGFDPIDTVMVNETQYTDTLYLQPETTYLYQVAASNCAYPDEFFSEASATTFLPAFVDSGWLDWTTTGGSIVLLGDYDNDKDLDLLLAHGSGVKLFRFEANGGFMDSGIQFPIPANEAHWFDYNNDNFLDILFVSRNAFNDPASLKLYKNEAGSSFSEVSGKVPSNIDIPWQGGLSLGDYDDDGDEDLLLQAGSAIHLYENNGEGGFTRNEDIGLSGHIKSSVAWADYDKDGDLDILGNKEISCEKNIVVIFENKSDKTFAPVEFPNLEGILHDYSHGTGEMKWGDYDNDGFPDIVVAGQNICTNASGVNSIYHNNGNKTFSLVATFTGLIYETNVAWGDYDNDGDLDVFAYGMPSSFGEKRTRIYKNDNGKFKESNIDYLLGSGGYGKTALGDVDSDGDLDYVIVGEKSYGNFGTIVYRNMYAESWGVPNHKPTAPGFLQSIVNNDQSVLLSWAESNDQETATKGLTYNVYLVNESNSIVLNSYSLAKGSRKVVTTGNAAIPSRRLEDLKPGKYRWAVQSIDKAFSGSEFSEENTFIISGITGVEYHAGNNIQLYPNPVGNYLYVTSTAQKMTHLEISNSLGQGLMRILIDKPESIYDISSLPAGLLVVTIYRNGAKVGTHKLVKN